MKWRRRSTNKNDKQTLSSEKLTVEGNLRDYSRVKTWFSRKSSRNVKLGKDAAAYADEIGTLATQTGLSTDTLQELNYMEGLVDVSTESVTSAMA